MTPWRIVAIGLAAWRIASFLSSERGPYAVADRLRAAFPHRAAVVLTEAGAREATSLDAQDDITVIELTGPRAEVGLALDCPYCSSVWLCGALTLLERHPWGRVLIDVGAAAAVAQALIDAGNVAAEAIEVWEAGGSDHRLPH